MVREVGVVWVGLVGRLRGLVGSVGLGEGCVVLRGLGVGSAGLTHAQWVSVGV